MKAKQDGKEFVLLENTSIGDKQMKVNLLGKQKNEYTVTIGVKPSCSYEFFTRLSASHKEVSCKQLFGRCQASSVFRKKTIFCVKLL